MAFHIPLHFEDLARPAAEHWKVSPKPLRQISPEELFSEVQASPTAILTCSTPSPPFTALYTLISHYNTIPACLRPHLLEFINTLVTSAAPTKPTELKIAAYFTSGLCATASAADPPCKFWEKNGRESALESAARLLDSIAIPCPFVETHLDQLCALHIRTVLCVLEHPPGARDKNARPVLARSLATALTLHPVQTLPAVTALLHALNRHEHLPGPLADLMSMLMEERSQLSHFVGEFVREIARISSDDLGHDVAAAKGCATFLSELSERAPAIFRANLALILSQLDGDSYTMRNGVVHVIGALIRAAPNADDPLLDVLLERAHRDIHAFTRSKALQTWIMLAQAKVIPNRMFPVLADMAASRLDDKAAAVRKYAAQLLAALLTNNPFGPVLHKSHFEQKLEEVRKIAGDNESVVGEEDPEKSDGKEQGPDRSERGASENSDCSASETSSASGEENAAAKDDDNAHTKLEYDVSEAADRGDCENERIKELETQNALKRRFYTSALSFVMCLETALDTVYKLLRSKSVTDVSEAVSLLVNSVQFQLEAASGQAVRKMLPLVLARESNIRQAVVSAYVRLLAPGGLESLHEKECAMAVATGLSALGVGATTGELACLESLISAMSGKNEAHKVMLTPVVAVLWDIFAGRVPGASEEQRRAACILVGMVAADHPESLQQRVDILEATGLSEPSFARWSCAALCNLPSGCDTDGHLSQKLVVLAKTATDLSTVEQALNAIFTLSTEPEIVVGVLIRDLAANLHAAPSSVSVKNLSRFLQVIGHVAVKELVRIEGLVSQVRRCVASHARSGGNNEEEEESAAEAEKALQLAEQELVNPSSLLGRYGNLARKIASDKTAPAELQASSVLCMAKLMCVQEKFCENNLRLLFSILKSASDPLVRSNAITSLGDLAFRFPNLVEPWNHHIYSALQDKDEKVRKNTLMALTHLILNDMIKVKGQIVGLAICILDENRRIADLARLFFHELARKSANAVYNILPDTISCMSRMEGLKADDFKEVVSFLIGLMDKERHADGMIEKLCHRFRTNESERENHDLAYCISQLNISERGLKKMNDNFKSFSHALSDDTVYDFILQTVNKGNKNGNAGSGASQTAEELIAKVEAVRQASNAHKENEKSAPTDDKDEGELSQRSVDNENADQRCEADEDDMSSCGGTSKHTESQPQRRSVLQVSKGAQGASRRRRKVVAELQSSEDDDSAEEAFESSSDEAEAVAGYGYQESNNNSISNDETESSDDE